MSELDDLVDDWDLRPDGAPIHTSRSVLLPVRTSGAPAVLKVGGSEHAHLVLRRWGGHGAARLLRADPHRRALLLERLRPQTLDSLPEDDACRAVVALYPRIHVPAMPQLPSTASFLTEWADALAALPRNAAIPHRLVEQAAALCRDLAPEPADTVLHGNLHFGKVLAADREAWLAIAPEPLNGDRHFELAPLLCTGTDGQVRDSVRRRFWTLIHAGGFDEDRARAYVLIRLIREATLALSRNSALLTRYITVAKAVLD